jgi:superfamily I DNA/RNA helicase
VKHVFEDTEEEKTHFRKNSFWIGDGRLKMSTIHSYKGWEALHIIMVIPEKWPGDENLDSLVYTAMTRTLENLIVLNCNDRYLEFSKDLPHEWEFQ